MSKVFYTNSGEPYTLMHGGSRMMLSDKEKKQLGVQNKGKGNVSKKLIHQQEPLEEGIEHPLARDKSESELQRIQEKNRNDARWQKMMQRQRIQSTTDVEEGLPLPDDRPNK